MRGRLGREGILDFGVNLFEGNEVRRLLALLDAMGSNVGSHGYSFNYVIYISFDMFECFLSLFLSNSHRHFEGCTGAFFAQAEMMPWTISPDPYRLTLRT